VEHLWNGTSSQLKYLTYPDLLEYSIDYNTPLVLGNASSSNHILYNLLSPKTGSNIGSIRLYALSNIAVICLRITNPANFTIKYQDSYVK